MNSEKLRNAYTCKRDGKLYVMEQCVFQLREDSEMQSIFTVLLRRSYMPELNKN